MIEHRKTEQLAAQILHDSAVLLCSLQKHRSTGQLDEVVRVLYCKFINLRTFMHTYRHKVLVEH
jgi:hypothetical protein